jgi:hypothetical protein
MSAPREDSFLVITAWLVAMTLAYVALGALFFFWG